jgi:aspartate-semialdehyde dehydrogenase
MNTPEFKVKWRINIQFTEMLFHNAISFEENGYTKEEMKLVRETQKILGDKTIAVTATAFVFQLLVDIVKR